MACVVLKCQVLECQVLKSLFLKILFLKILAVLVVASATAHDAAAECLPFLVKGQGLVAASSAGAKRSALADCRKRCSLGEVKGCSTGWLCKPVRYERDTKATAGLFRFDVLARPCPPRR